MTINNSMDLFVEKIDEMGNYKVILFAYNFGLYEIAVQDWENDNVIRNFRDYSLDKIFNEFAKWKQKKMKKEKAKAWQRELGMRTNSISKWIDTPLNF